MIGTRLSQLASGTAVLLALLATGCSDTGASPGTFQVTLSAEPASIGLNDSSTITAQVTNSRGQRPPGVVLEWSNSLAALQASNSVTDADGRARATLTGQGQPGVASVTARLVGRSESGQVEVRIGLD